MAFSLPNAKAWKLIGQSPSIVCVMLLVSNTGCAIGADQLAPGIAAEVSSLLGHISWAYLHPSRASFIKGA
jgi:hypothetical protein